MMLAQAREHQRLLAKHQEPGESTEYVLSHSLRTKHLLSGMGPLFPASVLLLIPVTLQTEGGEAC